MTSELDPSKMGVYRHGQMSAAPRWWRQFVDVITDTNNSFRFFKIQWRTLKRRETTDTDEFLNDQTMESPRLKVDRRFLRLQLSMARVDTRVLRVQWSMAGSGHACPACSVLHGWEFTRVSRTFSRPWPRVSTRVLHVQSSMAKSGHACPACSVVHGWEWARVSCMFSGSWPRMATRVLHVQGLKDARVLHVEDTQFHEIRRNFLMIARVVKIKGRLFIFGV